MKIQFVSDIHEGLCCDWEMTSVPFQLQKTDSDVIVIAGDYGEGAEIIDYAAAISKEHGKPVVVVAGNHEYYGHDMTTLDTIMKARADRLGVHYLQNTSVEIDGVTFYGGTCWTDYERQNPFCMSVAQRQMNDFVAIRNDGWHVTPELFVKKNKQFFDGLKTITEAQGYDSSKLVVVTHHAPSVQSCAYEFKGEDINYAYANVWDNWIYDNGPSLWIHGHVHNHNDYYIGATRVVSNPRGYQGIPSEMDPTWVIEINQNEEENV